MKEVLRNHSFKIQIVTIVSVILFIVSTTWNIATTANRIEEGIVDVNRRVDHLSDKYTTVRADITAMQSQETDIKIKLYTLEAILTRIEITQKEILKELK